MMTDMSGSGQRHFLALLSAMGAVASQMAAGFPHDPSNVQVAWFGLAVILTGISVLLLQKNLVQQTSEHRNPFSAVRTKNPRDFSLIPPMVQ
jgi:hypothetical protein